MLPNGGKIRWFGARGRYTGPMTAADTIYALSTAPGRAGIAVVRVSGPGAAAALAALAGAVPPPRQARVARLRDPRQGEPIDAGLVLYFPAPRSVTGEDVAEFHVHGGRAVIAALLEALAALAGMRLAEPGEFTRRGFLNGKLDLAAAEGLSDLIAAETAAQRRQALRQLAGEFGRIAEGWRARLIDVQARLEAAIDFPDEDLPAGLWADSRAAAAALAGEIAAYLADGRRGERLRDGLAVAIVGPPNAGKSSLMNALARREVAITAATAGTTRDVIEVALDLEGYPVLLADTAGLRPSGDAVEAEGVRRARARAASADLKLVVLDATRPEEGDALADLVDGDSDRDRQQDRPAGAGDRAGARPAAIGAHGRGDGCAARASRGGGRGAARRRRDAARHPRAPSRGARPCAATRSTASPRRGCRNWRRRSCASPPAPSAGSPAGWMSRTCSIGCLANFASANRTLSERGRARPHDLVAVRGTSRGRIGAGTLYLVLLEC